MKLCDGFVVVCGGGKLPRMIANEMKAKKKKFILLIIKNPRSDEGLDRFNNRYVNYGNIISELLILRKDYKNIILAGSLVRPSLKDIKPDLHTLKILPKLSKVLLKGGDNYLLTFLLKELERMKFHVLGVKNIIPNLFDLNQKTVTQPNQIDLEDIKKGGKVLCTLSPFDIGQSIIIQQGNVLGIEALEGTDVLIKRIKKLVKKGNKPILIKLAKQKQDLRVDLPTIGIKTIELCHNSNIKGIVYSKNKTVLIEKERIIKKMNEYKMFLLGLNDV